MSDEWWRQRIPETEKVLWQGRPDQGYFPPRFGWAYKACIAGLVLIWLFSPWFLDVIRDFWKLAGATMLLGFAIWADRFVRAQRMYVVTSRNAWEINKGLKTKKLEINQFLNFRIGRRAILFSRHPFFTFSHLSDPDAALQALTQAREAST